MVLPPPADDSVVLVYPATFVKSSLLSSGQLYHLSTKSRQFQAHLLFWWWKLLWKCLNCDQNETCHHSPPQPHFGEWERYLCSDPCVTTAAVGLVPGPSLCWSLYIVKPASWAGLGRAGSVTPSHAPTCHATGHYLDLYHSAWSTYTAYISLLLWNEVSAVCIFIRYNNSNKHFIWEKKYITVSYFAHFLPPQYNLHIIQKKYHISIW